MYYKHLKGIKFAILGAIFFSFDALSVKMINADPLTILFWRGLFGFVSMSFLWAGLAEKKRKIVKEVAIILKFKISFFVISFLYAIDTLLFIMALQYTTVANTVVILSTAGFFAAIFSWLILKQRIDRLTMNAIVMAFIGIVIIFFNSLKGFNIGDIIALIMAINMGLTLTLLTKYSKLPTMAVTAFSGLIAMVFSLFFTNPFELTQEDFYWLIVSAVIIIPMASALFLNSAKYINSTEMSMILLIETVMSPVWVYLILNEKITLFTFLGGAVVITSIFMHSYLTLKHKRNYYKLNEMTIKKPA
jgi:drug/metabolite transporter (DMT)-like permease